MPDRTRARPEPGAGVGALGRGTPASSAKQKQDPNAKAPPADESKDKGPLNIEYLGEAIGAAPKAFRELVQQVHRAGEEPETEADEAPPAVTWRECGEYLSWRVNVYNSLISLPTTLFFWAVFIAFIWVHCDIPGWFFTQDSVKQVLNRMEVSNRGFRESLTHTEAFTWIATAFVPQLWTAGGVLGSLNDVMGSVRIEQTQSFDDNTCGTILTQTSRRCRLRTSSIASRAAVDASLVQWLEVSETLDQVNNRMQALHTGQWITTNTSKVEVKLLLHNTHLKTLMLVAITSESVDSGFIETDTSVKATPINIYSTAVDAAPDIVLILLLLILVQGEMRQMAADIRSGHGRDYFTGLWNIVDWVTIMLGAAIVLWYVLLHYQLRSARSDLEQLLEQWEKGVVTVTDYHGRLERIFSDVDTNYSALQWHQVFLFLYCFVISMRFLKACRGQPRLNVLTTTMKRAWTDIYHFLIIYIVLFGNFALAAYLLFGSRLQEWSTPTRCVATLFGRMFDYQRLHEVAPASAAFWYWIQTIVLSMLLIHFFIAFVVEAYSELRQQKKVSKTLVAQSGELVRSMCGLYHDSKLCVSIFTCGGYGSFNDLERLERVMNSQGSKVSLQMNQERNQKVSAADLCKISQSISVKQANVYLREAEAYQKERDKAEERNRDAELTALSVMMDMHFQKSRHQLEKLAALDGFGGNNQMVGPRGAEVTTTTMSSFHANNTLSSPGSSARNPSSSLKDWYFNWSQKIPDPSAADWYFQPTKPPEDKPDQAKSQPGGLRSAGKAEEAEAGSSQAKPPDQASGIPGQPVPD